jgi:hypothetical protein
MKKGVFWLIDNELHSYPFTNPPNFPSAAAKSGNTYNHKKLWSLVKPQKCGDKPYNHYPHGSVGVSTTGEVIVYANPAIDESYIAEVKQIFRLNDDVDIQYGCNKHKCYSEFEHEQAVQEVAEVIKLQPGAEGREMFDTIKNTLTEFDPVANTHNSVYCSGNREHEYDDYEVEPIAVLIQKYPNISADELAWEIATIFNEMYTFPGGFESFWVKYTLPVARKIFDDLSKI